MSQKRFSLAPAWRLVSSVSVVAVLLGVNFGSDQVSAVSASQTSTVKTQVLSPKLVKNMLESQHAFMIWLSPAKERICPTLQLSGLFPDAIELSPEVQQMVTTSGLAESAAKAAIARGYEIGCTRKPIRKHVYTAGVAWMMEDLIRQPESRRNECGPSKRIPQTVIETFALSIAPNVPFPKAYLAGVSDTFAAFCSR